MYFVFIYENIRMRAGRVSQAVRGPEFKPQCHQKKKKGKKLKMKPNEIAEWGEGRKMANHNVSPCTAIK
jgi:hypothetical protein